MCVGLKLRFYTFLLVMCPGSLFRSVAGPLALSVILTSALRWLSLFRPAPVALPLILITMFQENIGCQPSPSDLYSVRCYPIVYESVRLEHPSHVQYYDQYNHHHKVDELRPLHFDFPRSRKVFDLPVCSVARIAFTKITHVSA